ncbi:hypothetical protein OIU79_002365 [Salix purpurea]|uniref:Uncharacterized protein n=1 Tax=Salix purpurea TaxID=77065 RepID=A0A9Q0ZI76_SALPP|nr:hypothetical protein OIU79_002365 [Salix purpurea]
MITQCQKVEVAEAETSSYPVEVELELGLSLGGGGGGGKGKLNAWGLRELLSLSPMRVDPLLSGEKKGGRWPG